LGTQIKIWKINKLIKVLRSKSSPKSNNQNMIQILSKKTWYNQIIILILSKIIYQKIIVTKINNLLIHLICQNQIIYSL